MRALFLREQGKLSLENTPKPELILDNDVIVKVTASSICGSDIHFWKGHFQSVPNFIIGHEFVGVISETGKDVNAFKIGDRVAVPAGPFCGICSNCKSGKGDCLTVPGMFGAGVYMGNLPGAQAEYVRVPCADACIVKIPNSVSDLEALLVGDVLSTGYFAVENCNPQPGDSMAIFGAGPVGLCAVACAQLFSPSQLFLIDLEDYRLEKGRQLGATHLLNPNRDNVIKEIKTITNGYGVDFSIDAVGLPQIMNNCITCTTPGGTISAVGIGAVNLDFPINKFLLKNLTLSGGLVPLKHMKRLLNLIEAKKLDVSSLITHTVKLENIIDAYHMFANKEDNCIKVMVIQ